MYVPSSPTSRYIPPPLLFLFSFFCCSLYVGLVDGMEACVNMDWRPNATKIVCIITDAPPHGLALSGDHFPEGTSSALLSSGSPLSLSSYYSPYFPRSSFIRSSHPLIQYPFLLISFLSFSPFSPLVYLPPPSLTTLPLFISTQVVRVVTIPLM